MKKRKHERKEIFTRINVEINKEKTISALMYDLSRGGLGFRHNAKVKHGDYCTIGLENDNRIYWLEGYIKLIEQVEGNADIKKSGLQFCNEMSEDDFIDLYSFLNIVGFK